MLQVDLNAPIDGNTEAAKPKVVFLGTLGNARKRTRDQMEANTGKPQTNGAAIGVSNENKDTNAGAGAEKKVPGAITPESKVTQMDESGHIEKMSKNAAE